ncbi:ATP-binding cassette domain-containing protein [Candidatus Methanomethylophilus sp. 1R26]|uniref:ATP-binding cassette domain-containing protein n=1 Tax=Candidatus Methanomethylophilus sp. 1R26 TaxID=1769296 RepID=UPI000AABCA08|nr:ATP-binding cassette domain-containing protein [Candidatus Methanomethylophilus sp. 1R26]
MLFRAESVTKSFGPNKVLTDANIQINEHDAIGLIGINGAGKSTFIKILLGIEQPDTGEVIRRTHRIGYLEQFAESSHVTVREVLGRPYGHIENIKSRMGEIDRKMAEGGDIDWNALATEYADLEQKLASCDVADEHKLEEALSKVGLDPGEMMGRYMDTLSGGERTKVMLARIVVQASDCDILVMDEPTSHLDIDTIEWLEDYMIASQLAFLVVSHDRYFLDKMTSRMVEIENGKTREYKGNYSDFIMKKMIDINRQEKEYLRYTQNKKQQEKIAAQMHHDMWYSATYRPARR